MNDLKASVIDLISGSVAQEFSFFMLRTIPGFPPIIQTVHILAISVVMGTIVFINLRVLGLAVPSQDVGEMIKRLMPWTWSALVCLAISGSFFIFARPGRYFNNPVFGWKFTFLIPAIALALIFHLLSRREFNYWQQTRQREISAKIIALASLGLWIMVAMAGRWIAYAEYIYYPA